MINYLHSTFAVENVARGIGTTLSLHNRLIHICPAVMWRSNQRKFFDLLTLKMPTTLLTPVLVKKQPAVVNSMNAVIQFLFTVDYLH